MVLVGNYEGFFKDPNVKHPYLFTYQLSHCPVTILAPARANKNRYLMQSIIRQLVLLTFKQHKQLTRHSWFLCSS